MAFVAEEINVRSMIDYFVNTREIRRIVLYIRVYRSAEQNTQLRLLIMKTRLRKERKMRPWEYIKINWKN